MKKGQRYIVTTGEYSDYGIADSFTALKDFSFDRALKRWLDKNGLKVPGSAQKQFSYTGPTEHDFLASLRTDGYVTDEPLAEVHMSDYGRPNMNAADDSADEAEVQS